MLPAFLHAEDARPLSATVSLIEIEVAESTVVRKSFTYAANEFQSEQQTGDTKKRKVPAGEVKVDTTVDSKFIDVSAQRTLGDYAEVFPVPGTKTYLIFGPPGKYFVQVLKVEPDEGLKRLNYVLTIPGTIDEPDKPDDPVEPPVGDFAELAKLAADLARRLNDAPTYREVVNQLSTTLPMLADADFEGSIVGIQRAIRNAVTLRRNESLKVDWEGGFRIPINEWFTKSTVKTKAEYLAAWTAILTALQANMPATVPMASGTASVLVPWRVETRISPPRPIVVAPRITNYNPRWTVAGGYSNVANHLSNWPHDVNTAGMTQAEMLRLHDQQHDRIGPVSFGNFQQPTGWQLFNRSCPGGLCPR